jgi:hypothetical protein
MAARPAPVEPVAPPGGGAHDPAAAAGDGRTLAGFTLPASWLAPGAVASVWVLWSWHRLWPGVNVLATTRGRAYHHWAYSHLAYSDVIWLYHARHLGDHALPYVHQAIEYPVAMGLAMWGAAWAPGAGGFTALTFLALWAAALACVRLLFSVSPRQAWLFALSPLLLAYSMLNWDLLAIAPMLAGYCLWRSGRTTAAGAVLALAVCAKWFPLVLLLPCLVATWAGTGPGTRRPRAAAAMAGAAAAVALALNLPFALANLRGWARFFTFNAHRLPATGLLAQLHLDRGLPLAAVDALVALAVGGAALGGAVAVARGRLSPAAAAAVTLAAFLLVNKTYSPQYLLWLFTLAVLAGWPVWTLVLLTVAGLVDYVNAWTLLDLHGAGGRWYGETVNSAVVWFRDAAIGAGVIGWTMDRKRPGPGGVPAGDAAGSGPADSPPVVTRR